MKYVFRSVSLDGKYTKMNVRDLTEGTASINMVTQVTALALRRSDTTPARIPPGKQRQQRR